MVWARYGEHACRVSPHRLRRRYQAYDALAAATSQLSARSCGHMEDTRAAFSRLLSEASLAEAARASAAGAARQAALLASLSSARTQRLAAAFSAHPSAATAVPCTGSWAEVRTTRIVAARALWEAAASRRTDEELRVACILRAERLDAEAARMAGKRAAGASLATPSTLPSNVPRAHTAVDTPDDASSSTAVATVADGAAALGQAIPNGVSQATSATPVSETTKQNVTIVPPVKGSACCCTVM